MSGLSGNGHKKPRGSWLMSCVLKLALLACIVPAWILLMMWSLEEPEARPTEMPVLPILGFAVLMAVGAFFGSIVIPAVTRRMEFRPSWRNFRQAGVYQWLVLVLVALTGSVSLYGFFTRDLLVGGVAMVFSIAFTVGLLEVFCFPGVVQRGNRTLSVMLIFLISSFMGLGPPSDDMLPPPGYSD